MNSKSILAPFFAAAFALCLLAQPLLAATFGLFTFTDNGTSITIDDYPNDAVGTVEIPATIIGKPVASIGEGAFSYCDGLTSVSIPNSVTSIGYNAFYKCTGLTSVSIPNSVTSIGTSAFSSCTAMTSVSIGTSVTSIGQQTFEGCSGLTSVSIPNSVISIGIFAFDDCSGLTSVAIPNSVITIGSRAFSSCSGLTSVSIPNSVTYLGERVFSGCTAMTSVSIGTGVTSIGTSAFSSCGGLTSVSIPNSVISIGIAAFAYCDGLTSVSIPNGVAYLGDQAFSSCTGLTSVAIPDSVITIGSRAFSGCTAMTSVSIGTGVTSIGQQTFEGCSGLTSVSIPNSVISIGRYAFKECTGLTSVSIGTNVTSIEDQAFYGCSGLTSVSIPNGVTSIGDETFSTCTGLTNAIIGSGVKSIGDQAFRYSNALSKAYFRGNAPLMGSYVFDNAYPGFSVYYLKSATGFTTPTWLGYWSVAMDSWPFPEIAVEQPMGINIDDGGSKDFGSVLMGSKSSLVFTIRNSGGVNLTGLTITKDGANATDFTVTVPPNPTVVSGGITTFTVRFAPTGTGMRSAALHIASNDADENPYDITLTGNGTTPEIAVEQPAGTNIADGGTKAFGNTDLGTGSNATFTIRNTGSGNLTGLTITKDGMNASDFTITANPVASVIAGGTTTFTVRFAPSATGSRTAAIHIASNDADENPYDITLTGTGVMAPEIAVEQPVGTNLPDGMSSRNFGPVVLGSSYSLTFTIKNTGTGNLTGLKISKNGTNATDFTITKNPVAPVITGGSTTFTVRFKPTTKGTRTAAIHIASNDGDENPFDIILTGTGTVPEIAVQQPAGTNLTDGKSSRNLGSVLVGKSSTPTIFTIKNTGTANLKNLAVTINGTHVSNFTVTAPYKTTLLPGGSTTFKVTFKPTAKGKRVAAIHIASNDADENPFDITLTGWGMAAATGIADASDYLSDLTAGKQDRDRSKTLITIDPTTGLKYLTLVVTKAMGTARQRRIVEVSPNLLDWYSGGDHTTLLRNDVSVLKVRDNTPITPGVKRYIRLKP